MKKIVFICLLFGQILLSYDKEERDKDRFYELCRNYGINTYRNYSGNNKRSMINLRRFNKIFALNISVNKRNKEAVRDIRRDFNFIKSYMNKKQQK